MRVQELAMNLVMIVRTKIGVFSRRNICQVSRIRNSKNEIYTKIMKRLIMVYESQPRGELQ